VLVDIDVTAIAPSLTLGRLLSVHDLDSSSGNMTTIVWDIPLLKRHDVVQPVALHSS
jgi:hypothetical protein